MANEAVKTRDNQPERIIPATEIVKKRRLTLLGHVIRAGQDDPLFPVVFGDEDLATVQTSKRRAGRPKNKWIEMSMKDAWNRIRIDNTEQYTATLTQRQTIKTTAENRAAPFSTKKK